VRGRDRRRFAGRWDVLAAVSAGGALGTLARWGLGAALPHGAGSLPWGTFTANVSGSLLLGLLAALLVELRPGRPYLRAFLGVGLLGGYTTFSAYMLETRALLDDGRLGTAAVYLLGTSLAGLLAVWAGAVLGRVTIAVARR
jgi:CrcB protein